MKWVLLAELCVGKLSWLPASIMTSPTQFWNNKNVARQSEIFQQSNVWRSGITANPLQSSKFHSHGASNLTTKAKIGILPSLKKNSEANYQKKICTLQIIIIRALFFFQQQWTLLMFKSYFIFSHIHRSYRSLHISPSLQDSLCAELSHCN